MTLKEINDRIDFLHSEVKRIVKEKYSEPLEAHSCSWSLKNMPMHLIVDKEVVWIEEEIKSLSKSKKELLKKSFDF